MKHVLFFIVLAVFNSALPSLKASSNQEQDIISGVISALHSIPLPDGYSLFGDWVGTANVGINIKPNIIWDKEVIWNTIRLRKHLAHPIKVEGIFQNTYFTAKEILEEFISLVQLAQQGNMSAIMFLKNIFEFGNIDTMILPGLSAQPERAYSWDKIVRPMFTPLQSSPSIIFDPVNAEWKAAWNLKAIQEKAKRASPSRRGGSESDGSEASQLSDVTTTTASSDAAIATAVSEDSDVLDAASSSRASARVASPPIPMSPHSDGEDNAVLGDESDVAPNETSQLIRRHATKKPGSF